MQQASMALDRDVVIQELELGVFPPTIELGSLTVRDGRQAPWIELHRAKVRVQPWPSASMGLVIDLIELDGLNAALTQAQLDALIGPSNPESETEAETSKSSSNLNIELGSVHLWNTRLDIDLDAFSFRASGLDLSLLPEAWSDHRISIDLKSGHLDIAGQSIPLEIRGTTVLSGSLVEPSNVQLQDLRVFLPRIAVAPRGSISLSEDLSAQLDFQAHGSHSPHCRRRGELQRAGNRLDVPR